MYKSAQGHLGSHLVSEKYWLCDLQDTELNRINFTVAEIKWAHIFEVNGNWTPHKY